MNKKDFIQALGVGVAFGLIVYCLMMVAVHFIDKNSESIIMTRQTNIIEIQKGCNYNGRDFNCNHSCQFFGLDSKYYNRYRDDNCSN